MQIRRIGSEPSGKGPDDYFTGRVRVDRLFTAPEPASPLSQAPAQRGTPTPLGQTLIVTAGCGWVQREGGPVEEIRPGDVVWLSGTVRRKAGDK
jgi:quercetin dioxygenase-like cupin family protein